MFALLGALGLIVVLIGTLAAFGLPILGSLQLIVHGALGSEAGIARTLVQTTPLLFTSLGMVVAWRAGMYSIGGEGQFIVGGIAGAAAYKLFPGLPPAALTVLLLSASIVGGAAYAGIAGWLQVRRGAQVVVSTILLNFIALQGLDWCVNGPLQEASHRLPLSDSLPTSAMLTRFNRQTDLHSGVFLSLAAAILVYAFLYWSRSGFQLRLVGENPRTARTARIDSGRVQLQAMLLSGALCGIAGGVELLGIAGQLGTGFSQQWGFLAIPVALLGGLNPAGVILSSLYFGGLLAGSENLARFTKAGSTIVFVIQAAAVLGFVGLASWMRSKRKAEVEDPASPEARLPVALEGGA